MHYYTTLAKFCYNDRDLCFSTFAPDQFLKSKLNMHNSLLRFQ